MRGEVNRNISSKQRLLIELFRPGRCQAAGTRYDALATAGALTANRHRHGKSYRQRLKRMHPLSPFWPVIPQ